MDNGQPTGFQTILDAEGNFTENWRQQDFVKEALGEDVVNDSTLDRFKRFPDAIKSTVMAQRLSGADRVVVPKEDSPDEVKNAWYKAIGRPDLPEQYQTKFEGLELSQGEKDNWLKTFHEAELNNKQAQILIDAVAKSRKETLKGMELQAEQERKAADEKLRALPNYNELMERKDAVLRRFDKNGILDQLGILQEPEVVQLLGEIGAAMSEDTLSGSHVNTATISAIQTQIEEIYQHPGFSDRNHPSHKALQEKLQSLYKQRSAG